MWVDVLTAFGFAFLSFLNASSKSAVDMTSVELVMMGSYLLSRSSGDRHVGVWLPFDLSGSDLRLLETSSSFSKSPSRLPES